MTKTIAQKANNDWPKRIVEWKNGHTAYLSIVFSWQLPQAYQRAVWLKAEGYHVRAGGPAVAIQPEYLADVAEIGGEVDALARHNPNATRTSTGCIRSCSFCLVSKIEGYLIELENWEPRSVVCDNNLLACSRKHFDCVIDRLKPLSKIDFNQGLDARLMDKHHADQLAGLDLKCVRLAWDSVKGESEFMRAFELLRNAGIAKSLIRVYVLIGFKDTPEDALYRLRTVSGLGALPNPMRYQPLKATMKNSYVAPGWTDRELKRYVRYWSNLIHTRAIPFDEFVY